MPPLNQDINIEHYLQLLQKKIEHTSKDPFNLPFLNYSFEQLSSWKNTVMQLDVTSKLYGQRVDHLHNGVVEIVNNVFLKQQVQLVHEQIKTTRKVQDSSKQNNLQQPERINGEIECINKNVLLWRQICKKCDSLQQIMLNQIKISSDLSLNIMNNRDQLEKRIQSGEIVDLPQFHNVRMGIFDQIAMFKQQNNMLLLNSVTKNTQRQDGCLLEDADLELANFDYEIGRFEDCKIEDNIFKVDFQDQQQREVEPCNNDCSVNSLSQLGSIWEASNEDNQTDDGSIINPFQQFKVIHRQRVKRIQKSKHKKNVSYKQQWKAEFDCSLQDRNEVFQIRNPVHKNNLIGKDITHLYQRSQLFKMKKQRSIEQHNGACLQQQTMIESPVVEYGETGLIKLHDSLLDTSNRQAKFSLRNIKNSLKNSLSNMNCLSTTKFSSLKFLFPRQDPLDIFTALLHLAAEDGFYLIQHHGDISFKTTR